MHNSQQKKPLFKFKKNYFKLIIFKKNKHLFFIKKYDDQFVI